jgi:hypothetical protein
VKGSKVLTPTEIVSFLLAMDPELDHIEISTQLSSSPFLLITEGGAEIEGVITKVDQDWVKLRQNDGVEIAVFKRSIAAVRRPITGLRSNQ